MSTNIFVVLEEEHLLDRMPNSCVVGAYSSKDLAQQAMVAAIRSMLDCYPDNEFGQELTDSGLRFSSSSVGSFTYTIVVRNLDEMQ